MEYIVRTVHGDELPSVLDLWARAETEPTHTDDLEALYGLIDRDPEALLVATADQQIVGSVIAAWDGWRGTIYRLAVESSHRRSGLATQLLRAAEDRLLAAGARRLQAIVVESDPRATGFWRATTWVEQSHRLRFVQG